MWTERSVDSLGGIHADTLLPDTTVRAYIRIGDEVMRLSSFDLNGVPRNPQGVR